ncbi:hypothetical protein J1614_007002 [Plenodomus biglobosus]|nr:hypothetical protein J1614_007002 [Plenodomus biglobosus]
MAARTWTPQSRSRSSSGSSSSSDTTMMDMPPQSPSRPARLRNSSQSQPSTMPTASSTTVHPAVHDLSFSLLLSLPRELRDRIYTAALTAPYLFSWPGKPPAKVSHHVNVNLLRANRQVYNEAVAILYSQNKLLFTHPSDLNIFRVIASPASQNITSVYFRIREKDLRLWTSYLSSKNPERSLKADLPNLKNLWLFMRCGSMGAPAMLGQLGNGGGAQGGGQHVQQPHHGLQLQALQNTLVQNQHQQAHMQQQTHGMPFAAQAPPVVAAAPQTTHNNHTPPPPPPAPVPFIQFTQGVLSYGGHANPNGHTNQQHNNNNNNTTHLFAQHNPSAPSHPTAATIPPPTPVLPGQPINTHPLYTSFLRPTTHPLYTSFLRFEREMGIEWLCLSLQDTLTCTSASATNDATTSSTSTSADPNTKPEVKIVCIMRIPRPEVDRLASLYPDELSVDRHGDARTRFWKVRGVELSLEFSGFDVPGEERERERERDDGEGEG